MRKCGRIRNACACACTECQREMGGGGGHLMGAPTNQKDGLWGQWWAKLPRVLEWQGRTGGAKIRAAWPGMEGGARAAGEQCRGGAVSGGEAPPGGAAPPQKGAMGPWCNGVTPGM